MSPIKTFEDVERWAKDHEAQHRREREEIRTEVRDMNDAAIKHVEAALEPVGRIETKVARVIRQNRSQSKGIEGVAEELRLAREERLKRRAEEEQDARRLGRIKTALVIVTPIVVAALAAWKGCHS